MGTLLLKSVILTGSADIKINTLYTLLGLTAALAVLTLIICFITLLKIIPSLKARTNTGNHAVDNVIAQITKREEEELAGDGELVAVITAAICASMGDAAPADGLVVRSIRRAGR